MVSAVNVGLQKTEEISSILLPIVIAPLGSKIHDSRVRCEMRTVHWIS